MRLIDLHVQVSAKNTFDASLEVIAARDHIMHVVYSFLQPQRIWDRLVGTGLSQFNINPSFTHFLMLLIHFPCIPYLCSTLPSVETPYPMLVLVGPQGSGKKELSMKLVEEFADYFGYG